MEYGKKDWQRSDGRLKTSGRMNQEKGRKLSAYRPADREKSEEKRPNEMMRMESSYGGISLGASRQKKLTMVVHEKRASKGPGLKKDNRELEGNRTASISELRGDFQTNSHSRRDSAFAFREKLSETPQRMMEQIQEMMDENQQRSGEKVLPFMNRKEDEAKSRQIQKGIRESQEKRDMAGHSYWSRRRESYLQEQTEKEEMRRQFFRELQFAREKSSYLMQEDSVVENLFEAFEGVLAEDGTEEDTDGRENPEDNQKNYKKSQDDYKNV